MKEETFEPIARDLIIQLHQFLQNRCDSLRGPTENLKVSKIDGVFKEGDLFLGIYEIQNITPFSTLDKCLPHYQLFGLEYAYRLTTKKVTNIMDSSEDVPDTIIEAFFLDDWKLADFNLLEGIWRETLLMYALEEDKVLPVTEYG